MEMKKIFETLFELGTGGALGQKQLLACSLMLSFSFKLIDQERLRELHGALYNVFNANRG